MRFIYIKTSILFYSVRCTQALYNVITLAGVERYAWRGPGPFRMVLSTSGGSVVAVPHIRGRSHCLGKYGGEHAVPCARIVRVMRAILFFSILVFRHNWRVSGSHTPAVIVRSSRLLSVIPHARMHTFTCVMRANRSHRDGLLDRQGLGSCRSLRCCLCSRATQQ
jgi:hypothetical protein